MVSKFPRDKFDSRSNFHVWKWSLDNKIPCPSLIIKIVCITIIDIVSDVFLWWELHLIRHSLGAEAFISRGFTDQTEPLNFSCHLVTDGNFSSSILVFNLCETWYYNHGYFTLMRLPSLIVLAEMLYRFVWRDIPVFRAPLVFAYFRLVLFGNFIVCNICQQKWVFAWFWSINFSSRKNCYRIVCILLFSIYMYVLINKLVVI